MADLWDRLRLRVVPALLTAFGVMLLTAGLLSYADRTTAGPLPSDTPGPVSLVPSPSGSSIALGSASPSDLAVGDRERLTQRVRLRPRHAEPDPRPDGQARACAGDPDHRAGDGHRSAHRRRPEWLPVVQRRDVLQGAGSARREAGDLPLRPRPDRDVPAVASMRRRSRTARRCWACWCRSTRATPSSTCTRSPASSATRRSLDQAFNTTRDRLWLQTSEGPNSTYPKLMLIADPVSTGSAAYDESHPKAHPHRVRVSGPARLDPVDPPQEDGRGRRDAHDDHA